MARKRSNSIEFGEPVIAGVISQTNQDTWSSSENVDSPSRRHIDPASLTPKQLERILKNRDAAKNSRERQRTYVEQLERGNSQLLGQTADLRSRVLSLELEKRALSSEITQLRSDFNQLKDFLLNNSKRKESVNADQLVDERLSPSASSPSLTQSQSYLTPQMSLRPTEQSAKRVLQASPSPSTSIEAGQNFYLGRYLATNEQLSARKHCGMKRDLIGRGSARRRLVGASEACWTRRSFHTKNVINQKCIQMRSNRPGRVINSKTEITVRRLTFSSTWSHRYLTDLVNQLIIRYQPTKN